MYDFEGGNDKGNFEDNVFFFFVEILGLDWLWIFFEFLRCLRENIVICFINEFIILIRFYVRVVVERFCISLDFFIIFVIFVIYFW